MLPHGEWRERDLGYPSAFVTRRKFSQRGTNFTRTAKQPRHAAAVQQGFSSSEACKGSRGSCRPSRLTVMFTLSVRCLCPCSGKLIAGGREPAGAMNDVPESVVLFSDMTRLLVSLFFLFEKRITYFSGFYHRNICATSTKTLLPPFSPAGLQAWS